jgi:acyl-CoA synthetase (AMP-forming)/AMP-acid ligase II
MSPQRHWSTNELRRHRPPNCLGGSHRCLGPRARMPPPTFVDYTADPTGVPRSITWLQVHQRAAALAQRIARVAAPGPGGGARAVRPGLSSGCSAWYAQTIAVPLFPPMLAVSRSPRLLLRRLCAGAVLTVSAITPSGESSGPGRAANVIAIDDGPVARRAGRRPPPPSPADRLPAVRPARLGRRPGSRSPPKPHRQCRQIASTYTAGRDHVTGVNWLPLFHDMGMLSRSLCRCGPQDAVLLDPPPSCCSRPAG